MASGKSVYLEQAILSAVFLNVPMPAAPTTFYLALSTAAYSATATTVPSEIAAVGYARKDVDRATNFTAITGSSPSTVSNDLEITWAAATENWGNVLSAYLLDAATAGNIWYGGDLAFQRTVNAGDVFRFLPGQLIFRES